MARKKIVPEAAEHEKRENRFSRDQLLASERFREKRDLLGALLLEGRRYTISNVEGLIEKYMKGKVK